MSNININKIDEKIFTDGTVHFCGIGGIGMSAIANVMLQNGIKVQGTDIGDMKSYTIQNLLKLKAKVFSEHKKANISNNVSCVVYSTAVNCDSNEEIAEAKARNIPVVHRSVALGYVMQKYKGIVVSGTHGKTTTTSLLGSILDHVGLDPVIVSGGIMNNYGANAKIGNGKYIVVEGDESDKSCLNLTPYCSIITNIEKDHAEHYNSIEEIEEVFTKLMNKSEIVVACNDDERLRKLVKNCNKKIVTYGIDKSSDFVCNPNNVSFEDGFWKFEIIHQNKSYFVKTKLSGVHNFMNVTGAVAVAISIGCDINAIITGISEFAGVKRRFTHVGKFGESLVIDDYAHHPTEIQLTLKSIREFMNATNRNDGKIICIFQPHRYSRVADLFDEFVQSFHLVDKLIITPIYAASEINTFNISEEKFVIEIKKYEIERRGGNFDLMFTHLDDVLINLRLQNPSEKDVIVFMGAGDVSKYSYLICDTLF